MQISLKPTLFVLSLCALVSLARAEVIWSNIRAIPDDLISTGDAWSALRVEDPQSSSYRGAADDIVLSSPTRIDRLTFYSVFVGDPNILGGDWYFFTVGSDDRPGALIAHGAGVPMTTTGTGWMNPTFGEVKRNTMDVGVTLQPGRYFVAFRSYQTWVNQQGKNNNGILSTRTSFGSSPALWSFDLPTSGDPPGSWVSLQQFNLVEDQEWAFELEGGAGLTEVAPSALTVLRGSLESGGLAELTSSDDRYLIVKNGPVALPSESPITIVFDGKSPQSSVGQLRFVLENRVSLNGLTQRLDLFDWQANAYDQEQSMAAPTTDTTTLLVATNPQRYIRSPDRAMRTRLRVRPAGPLFTNSWRTFVDQAVWQLQ